MMTLAQLIEMARDVASYADPARVLVEVEVGHPDYLGPNAVEGVATGKYELRNGAEYLVLRGEGAR